MKKLGFLMLPLLCLLLLCTACTGSTPPDDGTPEPEPHTGVFLSEYGTMIFDGDGESVTFDFAPELAEAAGLPVGEQSGSYVFLFQHKEWRYDKAERFRIAVADASYDFINDFTVTDENTVALQSPMNGGETILFRKGESE